MARVIPRSEPETAAEAGSVAASIDRLLEGAGGAAGWSAAYMTVGPHAHVDGLWTAEAWLANGVYLSLLGRSEADARGRLQEAVARLSR